MNISKIKESIKNNYWSYLNEEEKQIINNELTESEIRSIINNIWINYLTHPFDFEKTKEFKFLINSGGLDYFEYTKYCDLPLFTSKNHYIEILDIDKIFIYPDEYIGFIINVDWNNEDKLLLPKDFEKKGYEVNTRLKPLAVFVTSMGEGMISPAYEKAQILAEENNLLFLDLNKRIFDHNFEFTEARKEQFLINIISYYMLTHNLGMDFTIRNTLIEKYKQYILDNYEESLSNNYFEPNAFINQTFGYIQTKENYRKAKMKFI